MNKAGASEPKDLCRTRLGGGSSFVSCLHTQSEHAHGPTGNLNMPFPCTVPFCECEDFTP